MSGNVMADSRRCWACGEIALDGVCLGPHPEYDHGKAIAGQFVLGAARGTYRAERPNRWHPGRV